ncbi:hypothetical protein [Actinomadura sp.]|jgi:hypothetical protein|uniref:hypothetical protein n=1 Tax=Actinomadura sp. TaxID=1989 RepID=UPI003346FE66
MTTETPARPRAALDQNMVTTGFEVDAVEAHSITYKYDTMPGNRPQANGNKVFLWETNGHDIPRGTDPKKTAPVNSDRPNGDGNFPAEVSGYSYLLGYAVGPDVKNVCATVFVPAMGDGEPATYAPGIGLKRFMVNTLTYTYTMPPGSQPSGDGDWVGVWENQTPSALYTIPPKWFEQVPENSASGVGVLSGLNLLRGTSYILGYFKGGFDATKPKQSTLACSVTFHTP